LEIGQDVAEMLTVDAALATLLRPARLRQAQRRLLGRCTNKAEPRLVQRREIRAYTFPDHGLINLVGLEQLARIHPEIVDGRLHAAVAFLRAVAETQNPVAAPLKVIRDFLEPLRGDLGDAGVLRADQFA
jgi:hypothetical protein